MVNFKSIPPCYSYLVSLQNDDRRKGRENQCKIDKIPKENVKCPKGKKRIKYPLLPAFLPDFSEL